MYVVFGETGTRVAVGGAAVGCVARVAVGATDVGDAAAVVGGIVALAATLVGIGAPVVAPVTLPVPAGRVGKTVRVTAGCWVRVAGGVLNNTADGELPPPPPNKPKASAPRPSRAAAIVTPMMKLLSSAKAAIDAQTGANLPVSASACQFLYLIVLSQEATSGRRTTGRRWTKRSGSGESGSSQRVSTTRIPTHGSPSL